MTVPPVLALGGVWKVFGLRNDAWTNLAQRLGVRSRARTVKAVADVDLSIAEGEVIGLVGESGCGKSTLARLIAGITSPSSGSIRFMGQDASTLKGKSRRDYELAIQMVFQDSLSSLNPRRRVVDLIGEAPVAHQLIAKADKRAFVTDLLDKVGLGASVLDRLPHQLSGGQRTRVSIARAIAVKPTVLVCDEATASLDVSVQAQVLNLFMQLQDQFKLTYVFVSHDLAVVRHISHRIAVMYLGRIVELAKADELFSNPSHPYTQALLAEMPSLDNRKHVFSALKGEIPSPLDPPAGCHFHPRCPRAFGRCKVELPPVLQIAPGHQVACHLFDDGPAP